MNIPETSELLNLTGQRILVTGASGTIGSAIASRLSDAGASVAAQHFESPLRDLEAQPGITPIRADLSSSAGIDRMFSELENIGFSPTGVVNNAADQSLGSLMAMPAAQLQQMLALNAVAPLLIARHAAGHMQGAGAIVNISSIEGSDPAPNHGAYAASKAALNMLTRAMAQEFGANGIRVNGVAPGLIRRDGIEQDWPDGVARWQTAAPLTRLGEPQDVADAVLFLLSPASRWISGALLTVDGGMSCQTRW